MWYNVEAKQNRIIYNKLVVCVFLSFFDKNADALLLHALRVVKGFVWRQLELCVFCALASVGALFCL